MPRKRQPDPPQEPEVDPEVGICLLRGQIDKGRQLAGVATAEQGRIQPMGTTYA